MAYAPPTIRQIKVTGGTNDGKPIENGGATNDNSPTISGTAALSSKVTIYLNGEPIGSTFSGTNGQWSFDIDPALLGDDGIKTFTATTSGLSGVSEQSAPYEIELLTTPPADPGIWSADDYTGWITSGILDETITDELRPLMRGRVTPDTTVIIKDHGIEIARVQADATGEWEYKPTSDMPEGFHHLSVQVEDRAGNRSNESEPLNFVIDAEQPIVAIDTIWDYKGAKTGPLTRGSVTDDPTPVLRGQGEPGTEVKIYDDTGTLLTTLTVNVLHTWDFKLPPQSEGHHSYVAVGTSPDGKTKISSYNLTFDFTPPSAESIITGIEDDTGANNNDFVTSDQTLIFKGKINGTLDEGDVVQIRLDRLRWINVEVDADGNWSYDNTDKVLGKGPHTIETRVLDHAGNSSPVHSQDITIDLAALNSTITGISEDTGISGTDFVTSDQTLIIYGKVGGDLASSQRIEVRIDDGEWVNATYNASNNTWSYDNSATPLDEGTHTIYSRVIDDNGHAGDVSKQEVTIDTTAPVDAMAMIMGLSDETGATTNGFTTSTSELIISARVFGTLQSDERVQISLDGGRNWNEASYNAETNSWDFDNTAHPLEAGTYQFVSRVIDEAGNSNPLTMFSRDVVILETTTAEVSENGNNGEDQGTLIDGQMIVGAYTLADSDHESKDNSHSDNENSNIFNVLADSDASGFTLTGLGVLLVGDSLHDSTNITMENAAIHDVDQADNFDLSGLLVSSNDNIDNLVIPIDESAAQDIPAYYQADSAVGDNAIATINPCIADGAFNSATPVVFPGAQPDLEAMLVNSQIIV